MTVEDHKAPAFIYAIACYDHEGGLKWQENICNLVTTAGKTDIIDKYFKGANYSAAWYLGLKGSGAVSPSDTLASHAGWSEITPYSGNRPAIMFGTTVNGSNTSNAITVSINTTMSIAGAFIANASSGTSGVLYSGSDFNVIRSVASGDILSITPTLSVV